MANDQLTFRVVHTARDHKGRVSIVEVAQLRSGFQAFAYQCSLEEDLDGAPRGYGVNNPNPVDAAHNPDTRLQVGIAQLETSLCNATFPHQVCTAGGHNFAWVGITAATQDFATRNNFSIDRRAFLEARMRVVNGNLVPLGPHDPGIFPAIQPGTGPAPGFFVSATSAIADANLPEWDQRRFVDATAIPYAAWAGWWRRFGVALGDFGLAIRPKTGAASGFVFADAGTTKVGEVSRKLFETVAPDRNNEDQFLFLVFPRSGLGVADKFTDESVVQAQARRNISRLNNIPFNDHLPYFLALGADKKKFDDRRAGKSKESDKQSLALDSRYTTIMMALMSFGYSTNLGPDEPEPPVGDFDADKYRHHV